MYTSNLDFELGGIVVKKITVVTDSGYKKDPTRKAIKEEIVALFRVKKFK